MSQPIDAYHRWLGIPPEDQPPNYYRLLGLRLFEDDADVIDTAASRQMAHLRTYQLGKHADLSQRLLNEVSAAKVCLLTPTKKAEYDRQLRQQTGQQAAPKSQIAAVVPSGLTSRPQVTQAPGPPPGASVASASKHGASRPALFAVGGIGGVLLVAASAWLIASSGRRDVQPPQVAHDAKDAAGSLHHTEVVRTPTPPEKEGRAKETAAANVVASLPEPRPPATSAQADSPADRSSASGKDVPPTSGPQTPNELPEPPSAAVSQADTPPEVPESFGQTAVEPSPPQPVVVTRKPVPAAVDQQEIRRMIGELYDINASRKPDETLTLANKLAALAEDAQDATERFVLLRCASELTADADDPRRTLQLVDRISDEFAVDRLSAQTVVLDTFAKKATTEEQIGALVDASADVIDETQAAERFDLADTLSASVYRACQSAAGRSHRGEALARRRKVQELRDEWNKVRAARVVLQSNPDDAAAHEVVGRWYCVARDDWDQALTHFAKGTDPTLRALAARELADPPQDAMAQAELAAAWWDVAQGSDSAIREAMTYHARCWYEKALPSLSGVHKARAEMRIADSPQTTPRGIRGKDIFTVVRKALRTRSIIEGPPIGVAAGTTFQDMTTDDGVVVGFTLTIGKFGSGFRYSAVGSIQPLYLTSRGIVPGQVLGKRSGQVTTIQAKNGYAVGGLQVVVTQSRVRALRVVFMKIQGSQLNVRDAYQSDWYCDSPDENAPMLSGNGKPVVGLTGHTRSTELRRLALITIR